MIIGDTVVLFLFKHFIVIIKKVEMLYVVLNTRLFTEAGS